MIKENVTNINERRWKTKRYPNNVREMLNVIFSIFVVNRVGPSIVVWAPKHSLVENKNVHLLEYLPGGRFLRLTAFFFFLNETHAGISIAVRRFESSNLYARRWRGTRYTKIVIGPTNDCIENGGKKCLGCPPSKHVCSHVRIKMYSRK